MRIAGVASVVEPDSDVSREFDIGSHSVMYTAVDPYLNVENCVFSVEGVI